MNYSFFRDAGERAVSTFAQSVLSVLGLDALDVFSVDWKAAVGVGLGGALLSLLKSVAARNVGTEGTASLAD
jgi:hypothetical protein